MSKKREQKPVQEESESETESESESESESEPMQPPVQISKTPLPKPQSKGTQSGSSSGSESESESEREPEPKQTPAHQSKTPQAKPQFEESESRSSSESDESSEDEALPKLPQKIPVVSNKSSPTKKISNAAGTSEPSTPKVNAGKRVAETKPSKEKDAKKAKKDVDDGGTDVKKPLFQRIWSDDDEMALLKGILDYQEQSKMDPNTDYGAFLDFIKGKLHLDVNKEQLRSKMKRFKDKFANNKKRSVGGADPVFSKPREDMVYQLSKKIWGNSSLDSTVDVSKSKQGKKKNVIKENGVSEHVDTAETKSDGIAHNDGKIDVGKRFLRVSNEEDKDMEEKIERIGRQIFEEENSAEGRKLWMNLQAQEMEIYSESLQLKMAKTKLVIDALKSRSSFSS